MPFSTFCFFPHQFLVLRSLASFLHFVSQLLRSSDSHGVRHLFASFLLHVLILYSTARLFLLFVKTMYGSIWWEIIRYLPNTTAFVSSLLFHLHFFIPVYSGSVYFHWLPVRSLGYDFLFSFFIILFHHFYLILWIRVLN